MRLGEFCKMRPIAFNQIYHLSNEFCKVMWFIRECLVEMMMRMDERGGGGWVRLGDFGQG